MDMDSIQKKVSRNKIEIIFKSDLYILDRVVGQAVDFIKEKGLETDLFAFRLALYESLTNAVKHGNKLDAERLVAFEVVINKNFLNIVVQDSGEGFDWRSYIAEEQELPPVEQDCGRGLMLLKAYGYVPSYNQKGNVLKLAKDMSVKSEE